MQRSASDPSLTPGFQTLQPSFLTGVIGQPALITPQTDQSQHGSSLSGSSVSGSTTSGVQLFPDLTPPLDTAAAMSSDSGLKIPKWDGKRESYLRFRQKMKSYATLKGFASALVYAPTAAIPENLVNPDTLADSDPGLFGVR